MASVTRRTIHTPQGPQPIGPYSQAVVVDRTLYVSGQTGFNPDTMQLAGDDVESQTKQTMINIGNILEAAGSSFNNVVKTTVLLADIKDYAQVNAIYKTFFKEKFPARVCYEVTNLPRYARVEIETIAIVGEIKDV